LNKKISDKDKKDWEDFLSSNENLPNKDQNINDRKVKKVETYDLHGFSLEEANKKIEELIFKSFEKRVSKLTIVTGKGLHSQNEKDPYVSKEFGILKYSVPEYVKSNSELMKMINRIEDADIQDGGSGAFYIFLKKKL
jgi:DNA-nicking Smr family endonuclease